MADPKNSMTSVEAVGLAVVFLAASLGSAALTAVLTQLSVSVWLLTNVAAAALALTAGVSALLAVYSLCQTRFLYPAAPSRP